jgi:hypothetical protein
MGQFQLFAMGKSILLHLLQIMSILTIFSPFKVPAMGMLDNEKAFNIPKPCEDCYIVAMQGDLQFEDGTAANVENGAWLHHSVLYSGLGWTPGSKQDLVCSYTLLSAFMGWPHRIFASGNERTPVRLNTKFKYGMSVEKGDYFHLLYDLVNVTPEAVNLYLVMVSIDIPSLKLVINFHRHMNGYHILHQDIGPLE